MFTTKTYLRVKILSLAAEAQIIRREEKRWIIKGKKNHPIRMGLKAHRKNEVRTEQRSALLAYAFLRGQKYKQLEANCYTTPNWLRVADLATKYGSNSDRKAVYEEIRVWRGN
jgi:hypothetical protein